MIQVATLSTPQTQAGVLSFYDAPERGPMLNPKLLLIVVFVATLVVVVLNHFVTKSIS